MFIVQQTLARRRVRVIFDFTFHQDFDSFPVCFDIKCGKEEKNPPQDANAGAKHDTVLKTVKPPAGRIGFQFSQSIRYLDGEERDPFSPFTFITCSYFVFCFIPLY